ncbi:cyclin-dependent protein kinase inhibitor SMR6-like [Argentina anserina]|uniref:cyclin-dependent protein kinase inhibitor SMR6-like n=1 Tax=Argentina anserina TaxID=57926 RepID=UPI002176665F|nr:cyclin-dependent protein kinase inhibitor SMR6-like [Potentilla anserina]
MGFSGDLGLDSDPKKWVIAGISLRAPLQPIYTNPVTEITEGNHGVEGEDQCGSTTPTAAEARIPTRLACPPPPRKRKSAAASKCNYGSVREFFTPPDLESVFIRRHVERAN